MPVSLVNVAEISSVVYTSLRCLHGLLSRDSILTTVIGVSAAICLFCFLLVNDTRTLIKNSVNNNNNNPRTIFIVLSS